MFNNTKENLFELVKFDDLVRNEEKVVGKISFYRKRFGGGILVHTLSSKIPFTFSLGKVNLERDFDEITVFRGKGNSTIIHMADDPLDKFLSSEEKDEFCYVLNIIENKIPMKIIDWRDFNNEIVDYLVSFY